MPNKTHRKPKSGGRVRHNISLDKDIREAGEKLAKLDNRSFSNLLEKLISTEAERCGVDISTLHKDTEKAA